MGLNISFQLRILQMLRCLMVSQMWHKSTWCGSWTLDGQHSSPLVTMGDAYYTLGKSVFPVCIEFELKCLSLISCFADQLQMWNGKETSPCYWQVAKSIFSILQVLPCPFTWICSGWNKKEASLWLLHCTDAHSENALYLEKLTSALLFFSFCQWSTRIPEFFLIWAIAGDIVISVVC